MKVDQNSACVVLQTVNTKGEHIIVNLSAVENGTADTSLKLIVTNSTSGECITRTYKLNKLIELLPFIV